MNKLSLKKTTGIQVLCSDVRYDVREDRGGVVLEKRGYGR